MSGSSLAEIVFVSRDINTNWRIGNGVLRSFGLLSKYLGNFFYVSLRAGGKLSVFSPCSL